MRVAREAGPPQVVPEQDDERRARLFVSGAENAAHERPRGRDAERRGGDLRDFGRADVAVGGREVERDIPIRADVGHRPQRFAPHQEVVQRPRLGAARRRVPVPEQDDAIAAGQRQGGVGDQRGELESDGADPDAERHRQAADDREARVLHQHAEAEPEVERQSAEPGEAASGAECLPVLFGAAEGDERPPPRFGAVEARLADQPLRLHVEVEAEFPVHPGFGGAASEHEAEPRARPVEPAHEVRSTVSSPAAKRRQLSTSCASARRPAAVSR